MVFVVDMKKPVLKGIVCKSLCLKYKVISHFISQSISLLFWINLSTQFDCLFMVSMD